MAPVFYLVMVPVLLSLVIEEEGNIEIPSVLHSDGSRGEVLTCKNPTGERKDGSLEGYVAMDGREIYKFAVRQVPAVIDEFWKRQRSQ